MASETQIREAFDRYSAAFKSYQDAVSGNLPEGQIQNTLNNYLQAKNKYSVLLGENGDSSKEENSSKEFFESEGSIEKKEDAFSSGPSELDVILEDLWSDKGKKKPDDLIESLKRFIALNESSPMGYRAKFELAKAYEFLKNDRSTAENILETLSKNPKGNRFRAQAKESLAYVSGGKKEIELKKNLFKNSEKLMRAFQSYSSTSWLAFPVKLLRYETYMDQILTLDNSRGEYKDFKLRHEALGAKFLPPVETVFDLFKPASNAVDSEARVRLLYKNSESWFSRWTLLSEAKKSIDIQYFIVERDPFGNSFQGLLLRKAKEGLKIRYMVDDRGTLGLTHRRSPDNFLEKLAKFPNVEVKTFNPIQVNLSTLFLDLRKIQSSNHDKIIIVDEEFTITGGRNIARSYFADLEDYGKAYRDCDVVISSPEIAGELKIAFDEEFEMLKAFKIGKSLFDTTNVSSDELEVNFQAMDYFLQTGKPFETKNLIPKTSKILREINAELVTYKNFSNYSNFDFRKGSFSCPVKIIDKHSITGYRNDLTEQIIKFIDSSKSEIVIQNPYIVLTERAEAALKRAGKRGVKIYVHTNSPVSSDMLPVQSVVYSDWRRILKDIPNLKFFVQKKQNLHAKVFVFDQKVSIVGTYNLDFLSEEVNSEVVAAIRSKGFSKELRNGIMSDIAGSKQYKIEVLPNGNIKTVFGPEHMHPKNLWQIRILSRFGFLKPMF